MTLPEEVARNDIYVDFGAEIMYGSDKCYIDDPCRFPTVNIALESTEGLIRIADRIRADNGKRPAWPIDGYTDEDCDCEGWYDFHIRLNGFLDNHIDDNITCVCCNFDDGYIEDVYTIDLPDEAQKLIFQCIDEQCRKNIGEGCQELLAHAEEAMREDFGMEVEQNT